MTLYRSFLAGVCLFASLTVSAQVDRTKLPEPGPAPEIQLGDYESFTLKNGLKVFVVQNNKLPQVGYSLMIDREPVLEGDKAGYVGVAGSLLRSGTTNRSKDELDEAIDFIGANLSTSSTGVYASALSKHKETLMALMADVLLNPAFPQEEFDRLIKQEKSGLAASKENAEYIAGNVRAALLYGKEHPYGELKTEATVENITLEDIQQYYQTYFKPNEAYLAIVGDISVKDAKKLVKKYLGDWERGEVPAPTYEAPEAPAAMKVAVVDRPTAVQSVLRIANTIQLEPGTPDVIPASIMSDILGGGDARLFNNLREDKGYTYGAYANLSSDELVGSFNASASVRNAVTDSAVQEFLYEMNRIRTEPVSDEELQKTKNYLTGSFARSLESPQTIARFALNTERYGLDKDYYRNYLKMVEATSAADVQRVAEKYIQPDHAYIIAVGNADEIAPKLKRFGELTRYDMYGEPVKEMAAGEVDANAVIGKYLEAIGGPERLKEVTEMRMDIALKFNGMELTSTQMKKLPGKYMMEMSMGGNTMQKVVVSDGQAFMVMGGQKRELPEKQAAAMQMSVYPFPEIYYAEKGITTEVKGVEEIDGKQAYKMVITTPEGDKTIEYFAVDSGLKVKTESPSGTVVYKEYTEKDGIKYPSKISMLTPQGTLEGEVSSIVFNADLADEMFQ